MSGRMDHSQLLTLLHDRWSDLPARIHGGQLATAQADWDTIETQLRKNPDWMESLLKMQATGGEPRWVELPSGFRGFVDGCKESPKGRRSLCYDREARLGRKELPHESSAQEMADQLGGQLMTYEIYREVQALGPFDAKSSSWLQTPEDIRKLGGAIFGDYRYGTVFQYHNGADSYYASRGFRVMIELEKETN